MCCIVHQHKPFKELSSNFKTSTFHSKFVMAEFLARQLKNICVFCENDLENLLDFINTARELGRVIGE